ncbi:hypothetical protein GCM10010420_35820 [Streptomyces glaucosporus]|uniref:Uncharacterized protein n=1 Tax=Streptomyces glaucosporus TaxID=284044 RepID=A0ABN3IIS6_9ACTN
MSVAAGNCPRVIRPARVCVDRMPAMRTLSMPSSGVARAWMQNPLRTRRTSNCSSAARHSPLRERILHELVQPDRALFHPPTP